MAAPDKGKGGFLFRGCRAFEIDDELLERGGCERCVGLATSDRLSAFKEAARDGSAGGIVLLKIRVDELLAMAPDLTWCAVFPKQTELYNNIYEYAYPPFTHYRPVVQPGQKPLEEKKMGPNGQQVAVTILEVVPCLPY